MARNWRKKKGIIFIILMLSAHSGGLFAIIEQDKPLEEETGCMIERVLFAGIMDEFK